MNDKLLNITMTIFFASIIINGLLLMVSMTPGGGWITGLPRDDLGYSGSNNYTVVSPDGFISNTPQSQDASSFNPFEIVTGAGNTLLGGINALNLIISGLFLLEITFFNLSVWFPLFSPFFLSLAALILGAKLLLIGYGASILLSPITGRR